MSKVRVKMLNRVVTTDGDGESVTLEAGKTYNVEQKLVDQLDANTKKTGNTWYERTEAEQVADIGGESTPAPTQRTKKQQAEDAKAAAAAEKEADEKAAAEKAAADDDI